MLSTVLSCFLNHEVSLRAHVLLEYQPQLVFKSGDYFVQHIWWCIDNSRVATNRERHLIE